MKLIFEENFETTKLYFEYTVWKYSILYNSENFRMLCNDLDGLGNVTTHLLANMYETQQTIILVIQRPAVILFGR